MRALVEPGGPDFEAVRMECPCGTAIVGSVVAGRIETAVALFEGAPSRASLLTELASAGATIELPRRPACLAAATHTRPHLWVSVVGQGREAGAAWAARHMRGSTPRAASAAERHRQGYGSPDQTQPGVQGGGFGQVR